MREFGKTPRKSVLRKILEVIFPSWFGHDKGYRNFEGHNERMRSRRGKTLFDR